MNKQYRRYRVIQNTMKGKKTNEMTFHQDIKELNIDEMKSVIGGQNLSFWIDLVVGTVVNAFNGNQSSGQRLVNAALG